MDERRDDETMSGALDVDPGWGAAVRGLLLHRTKSIGDGLIVFRLLFLSLVMAALLIGYVLMFLDNPLGEPEALPAAGVVALGLTGIAAAAWTQRRPLPISDEDALAAAFRTNFFLGFALAESTLLIAFVLTFLLDAMWPYFVALPFYLAAMWRIAPRRGNLERHEQELRGRGSPLSLTAALRRPVSRG